jgi:hypothetical protein
MSFIIESEESKRYLQEENALDGFRIAVNNGQTRLALQILVSIIDTFGYIFETMMEDDQETAEEVAPVLEQKVEEVKPAEIVEPKVEEAKVEEAKKPAAKKPAVKEETTTASE